ncbi:MAG: hypothetical protein WCP29_12005 [Acidobacteriota bacterium]
MSALAGSENGVGLPDGFDLSASRSLGLKLVSVLAGQLRGTFHLTSGAGVRAEIRFPLTGDSG